jgi:plasmid stabilization system protein ParE
VRVELHPEARAEVRAAALWYDERLPGLGDEFIERVNEVLRRLEELLLSIQSGQGRKPLQSRSERPFSTSFPYLVAFELHTESVLVLAVAHAKRQPLYWLARTSQKPG